MILFKLLLTLLVTLWQSCAVDSIPSIDPTAPSLNSCGLTEDYNDIRLGENPGYVSSTTPFVGNFENSGSVSSPVIPPTDRQGSGYYALFQNTADPNITFVPGAAARFQVGNFFRNGAAPCKANFFYRLFGWSRLSLYQEVRGNVSLLWTQGGHVNPWMQAYVNIPPNPYGTVQLIFEGVLGANLQMPTFVAFDDFHYSAECCSNTRCTAADFQCQSSECLSQSQVCDGTSDCSDFGIDEQGCPPSSLPRPTACAPSCPLDSVSPQQLEMATVTRGPGWVYGTEDGSFGTTEIGRVVNATYFRETGQAIIQWINQAVRVYPVTRVPNVLCFVFPPSVCGISPPTGPNIDSNSTDENSTTGEMDLFELCRNPGTLDFLPNASTIAHLQSSLDSFDWDLVNTNETFPGEPQADVLSFGGYLIARTDAGGGVKRTLGQTARFYSPLFAGPGGTCTFSFHYILVGCNRLNVFITDGNGTRHGPAVYSTVDVASNWRKRLVTFTSFLPVVQIEWEMVVGSGGYVAIDNLVLPWACCGLSSCDQPTEFDCLDNVTFNSMGQQVPTGVNSTCLGINSACNGIFQCRDGTDELGCYNSVPSTLPSVCSATMIDNCTTGEIYQLLRSRLPLFVTRGPGWMYGYEDGGSGNIGFVTSLENFSNTLWLKVNWSFRQGIYRYGAGGFYDLCLSYASNPPQQCNDGITEPPTQPNSPGGVDPFSICSVPGYLDDIPDSSFLASLQSTEDDFDWELINPLQNRSGIPTLDVSGSGGYLIVEVDNINGTGGRGLLGETSSFYSPAFAGPNGTCTFSFSYNIEGCNRLNVFVTKNSTRLGPPVFSTASSTGMSWVTRYVTFTSDDSNIQVEWEMVVGSGGYVAIDNFVLPWACCGLSSCDADEYSCQDNVTLTAAGRRVNTALNETCVSRSTVCDDVMTCSNRVDENGCYNTVPTVHPAVCSFNRPGDNCTAADIFELLRSRLPVTVTRGTGWVYGNEDGGSGNLGTITSLENFNNTNRVKVTWRSTKLSGIYRMGVDRVFDLCINYDSVPPQSCDHFPSPIPTMPTMTTSVPVTTSGMDGQCVSPVDYQQWLRDIAEWRRLFVAWRNETAANFCSELDRNP